MSGTLQFSGSGEPLASAAHPVLAPFVVVPYGVSHRCGWHATARAERPLLLAFWGCGGASKGAGALWEERRALVRFLHGHGAAADIRVVDTCGTRPSHAPGSNSAPRRFDVSSAQADYGRARFCVTPPGDAISTSRLFDAVAAGCVPVATNLALVLPFAASLRWDDCVLWHEVRASRGGVVGDDTLLPRLRAISATELQRRQRACAQLRTRAVIWDASDGPRGAHGDFTLSPPCENASDIINAMLVERVRQPSLVAADRNATLHSIRFVRGAGPRSGQ